MKYPYNLRTLADFGAFLPDADEVPKAQAGELKPAIQSAVRAAIEPGVRTAIALSGGVDSACVAAMADGAITEAWVLDAGGAVAAAKHAAQELGIPLRIVSQGAGGVLHTPVAHVVAALGHPTHSAAPFAFLQLYRAMAADGVQRVLTGDGADELFAGHAYHRRRHPDFAEAKTPTEFWSAYSALRGVGAQVELRAIVADEYYESWESWTESEFALATFEAAMGRSDAADRLRFVDVSLRMRAQCVDLQAALCAFVGLGYAAPLSAPHVVATALATPTTLDQDRGKAPLRRLLSETLGCRWNDVPKDPIASQTGGRTAHELPAEWQGLLASETVEQHGIFKPDAVRDRRAALDPTNPWLPRSLVVVATAHARAQST